LSLFLPLRARFLLLWLFPGCHPTPTAAPSSLLTSYARRDTIFVMKVLLETGRNGRLSAPPEKRCLIRVFPRQRNVRRAVFRLHLDPVGECRSAGRGGARRAAVTGHLRSVRACVFAMTQAHSMDWTRLGGKFPVACRPLPRLPDAGLAYNARVLCRAHRRLLVPAKQLQQERRRARSEASLCPL